MRGEPNGILRGCTRYVKSKSPERSASEEDKWRRTVELFRLWQRDRAVTLQEPLSATAWNKDQGQAPAER